MVTLMCSGEADRRIVGRIECLAGFKSLGVGVGYRQVNIGLIGTVIKRRGRDGEIVQRLDDGFAC
jgi:hypothetical protein